MRGLVVGGTLVLIALRGATAMGQGVTVLTSENSDVTTQLNVLRDEAGFTACGVNTNIFVHPTGGQSVEVFTFALVVAHTGNVIFKATNATLTSTSKVVKHLPTRVWIGKATTPTPFSPKTLVANADKSGVIGTGSLKSGIEALQALAAGSEPMQLFMSSKASKYEQIFQFKPPALAVEELDVLVSCLGDLEKRSARNEPRLQFSPKGSERGESLTVDLILGTKLSPEDARAGIEWLRQKCDKEDEQSLGSCSQLGVAFLAGAIEPEPKQSALAFQTGCRNGDATACSNLARFIRSGTFHWLSEKEALAADARACGLDRRFCTTGSTRARDAGVQGVATPPSSRDRP